jgi:hypothetical protein
MAQTKKNIVREILERIVTAVDRREAKRLFIVAWKAEPRRVTCLPDFEQRCLDGRNVGADLNDVRHCMLVDSPRRMHLQLNGNALGECYAPFLCVHYWAVMPYELFVEQLGDDFGRSLVWGKSNQIIFHRALKGNGLARHHSSLAPGKWLWVDPSGGPPYLTPGKCKLEC